MTINFYSIKFQFSKIQFHIIKVQFNIIIEIKRTEMNRSKIGILKKVLIN